MADETETVDLEDLIGEILDKRGLTKERFDSLDGISALGAKLDQIALGAKASSTQTTGTFDEAGFLAKISTMVDEKIKTSSPASVKRVAPLSKWLGLGGAT